MKKIIMLVSVAVVCTILVSAFIYRNEINLLYKSLNSFKDENFSNTFQNIYKIQPTKEIKKEIMYMNLEGKKVNYQLVLNLREKSF